MVPVISNQYQSKNEIELLNLLYYIYEIYDCSPFEYYLFIIWNLLNHMNSVILYVVLCSCCVGW